MATFVNDLRLTELATGEGSGTWGTTTNTNLELVAEAFSFGTEAITTNADTHTTTLADGSTDPGRSIFLKYTGTLDSACTITIGPNTVSKLWLIENATSGSQNIIIKQGSGSTITIPNGQTKAIYSDGAGSGGAMVDAFQDLSIPDLFIDDDLTFTSDSAVITFGADGDTTLTHTDGSGLTLNSTNKLMFNDASQFIQGSSATVLSLGATDEIDLTATLIDINGNADVSGTVTATGTSVFASLDISGDIDVDGTTNLDVVDIDGAVDMASTLQVDGAITSSAGATISVTDNSDVLHLKSTDDDANVGPVLLLNRVSSSPADSDVIGSIDFDGRNDAGQAVEYAQIISQIMDASDGTEDGALYLQTIVAGTKRERVSLLEAETVFNNASVDLDFRVESDGNTHMLFVDANNDTVVIGSGSITAPSTVDFLSYASAAAGRSAFVHGSGDGGVVLSGTGSGSAASLIFGNDWGSDGSGFTEEYRLIMDGSDDSLQFKYNGNASTALTLSSAGAATFGGTVTANSGVVVDNITIDGTEIDLSSGDLTLDVAGDIILDAGGAQLRFHDDGTDIGVISNESNNLIIKPQVSDADLIFKGNDGGSTITAMTFDMSAAGRAIFGADADMADGQAFRFGDSQDFLIYHSSNENIIQANTTDQDIIFKGVDGGSSITALTLDMSDAGAATFNGHGTFNDTVTINSTSSGALTIAGTGGGINFTGGNNRVNFTSNRALEGATDGSTLTVGEDYTTIRLSGAVVANESGADADFRVESNGNANLFKIDANSDSGAGQVICGSATAIEGVSAPLAVNGFAHTRIAIDGTDSAGLYMTDSNAEPITIRNAEGDLEFYGNAAHEFVFNEDGINVDFRVESDNSTHAIFVDAGNDRIAFGFDSSPDKSFAFKASASSASWRLYDAANGTDWVAFDPVSSLNRTIEFKNSGAGNIAVDVQGALSKSSGSFKIDHPLPAKRDTHHLVHSFVEAPQANNIYRGKVDLVAGAATVNIDSVAGMTEGTFVLLNREVQCFTSNESGWTAVKGAVSGNTLTITAQDNTCTDTISWLVIGERQDQHMFDTNWTDENGKVIVEPLKQT